MFHGILDHILRGFIVLKSVFSDGQALSTFNNIGFDKSRFLGVKYLTNMCVMCDDVCGVCGEDLQVGHGVRGGQVEGQREEGGRRH